MGGFAMKRLIIVACLTLVSFGFTYRRPQPQPYRVAFDLTSRDSLDQAAVVRWIREVTTASPNAEIEVVMYGKGFEIVMPERSKVTADVQRAMTNPKVSFKVCAIAMKNNSIEKSQLLPGTQIVPDGIYELVSKQQENWGYIKVSH
jgi:intracellular sulfur oxidation DsrE/DsrF family protein